MRSKCIGFTSGRKSVTGNIFSDIDFLYDIEIFAVRRCFSSYFGNFSVHMRSFDHITTSGVKCDVIFEFSTAISYNDAVTSDAGHCFRRLL